MEIISCKAYSPVSSHQGVKGCNSVRGLTFIRITFHGFIRIPSALGRTVKSKGAVSCIQCNFLMGKQPNYEANPQLNSDAGQLELNLRAILSSSIANFIELKLMPVSEVRLTRQLAE
mmetsp:Transcript_13029/g.24249  ORF Transcript_13029/g.24249 Transcript_13029/m.24249 type:complete len:117 (+) Transcript_13029:628-978(+)